MIHLISLNNCGKHLWESPTLKKFITKTNWEKALKHKRNRKTFVTNCLKKKGTHPNQFFVTENKLFWKIKPFFWNRGNYGWGIARQWSDCEGTKWIL